MSQKTEAKQGRKGGGKRRIIKKQTKKRRKGNKTLSYKKVKRGE
jgi:hypothetical protein